MPFIDSVNFFFLSLSLVTLSSWPAFSREQRTFAGERAFLSFFGPVLEGFRRVASVSQCDWCWPEGWNSAVEGVGCAVQVGWWWWVGAGLVAWTVREEAARCVAVSRVVLSLSAYDFLLIDWSQTQIYMVRSATSPNLQILYFSLNKLS